MSSLVERYDGVLLDAYGVLVDGSGALPGARALIETLDRTATPYAIVTNDASRSQATYARRFAELGLPIPGERVVSAGSLIPGYFREAGLAGARAAVLGTADSIAFVAEGGGVPVAIEPGFELDALVVCDDAGFPFLAALELTLSAVVRALDAGRTPALILPNPDLVYPKGGGELGVTAGSIALVIEHAIARRCHRTIPFVHLGKPEPRIFREAAASIGVPLDRVVAIGDQLETDVAGARAAGISVALVEGVSRWAPNHAIVPTYLLRSIA